MPCAFRLQLKVKQCTILSVDTTEKSMRFSCIFSGHLSCAHNVLLFRFCVFSTFTSQMLAFLLMCFCCNSIFWFQTICKPVCGSDRMPFQLSCSRSWTLSARPGHSCHQTPRTLCSICLLRTLPRGLLPLKLLIIGAQLCCLFDFLPAGQCVCLSSV